MMARRTPSLHLLKVEVDSEGGDSGFRLFSNGDVLLQVALSQ